MIIMLPRLTTIVLSHFGNIDYWLVSNIGGFARQPSPEPGLWADTTVLTSSLTQILPAPTGGQYSDTATSLSVSRPRVPWNGNQRAANATMLSAMRTEKAAREVKSELLLSLSDDEMLDELRAGAQHVPHTKLFVKLGEALDEKNGGAQAGVTVGDNYGG